MNRKNSDEITCRLMLDIKGHPTAQSPAGQLYLQNNILVFEFIGRSEPIKIPVARIRDFVQFGEESIRLTLPFQPEKTVTLVPHIQDGEGRFAFYSLRSWTQQIAGKTFSKTPAPYWRFRNHLAKVFIFFQLVIPYLIYYALFFLNQYVKEQQPFQVELLNHWQNFVFSPWVAIHYCVLGLPAFFALVFSHRWALVSLVVLSFTLILTVAIVCIVDQGDYYKIFAPYMVAMTFPAFYYIYAINRH